MGATEGAKEAVWFNDLVGDVDVYIGLMRCSWKSKISLRIEFIYDKNYYVKFSMSRKDVTLKKFLAVENSMDMWTKIIPLDKFKLSLDMINICDGWIRIGALGELT